MPTRFSDHSATLIHNIFTNQLVNHDSGVLSNSISDHQMLFLYSKNNRTVQKQVKYREVEVKNTNAMNALLREVESRAENWWHISTQKPPNVASSSAISEPIIAGLVSARGLPNPMKLGNQLHRPTQTG